jgi:hypothetical protein
MLKKISALKVFTALSFCLSTAVTSDAATPLPLKIDFEDMVFPNDEGCLPGTMYRDLYGVDFIRVGGNYPICNRLLTLPGGYPLWAPFIQAAGTGRISYMGFPSGAFTFQAASFPDVKRISFTVTAASRNFNLPGDDPHEFATIRIFSGGAADPIDVVAANHTRVTINAKPGFPIRGIAINTLFVTPGAIAPTIVIDDIDIGGNDEEPFEVQFANLRVTQAVANFKFADSTADLDLVAGKSAAIQYDLVAKGFPGASTPAIKILTSDSKGNQIASRQISAAELIGSTSDTGTVNSKTFLETPYIPTEGVNEIKFTLQVGDKSNSVSRVVRVKKTRNLAVSYVAVSGAFDCPTFGTQNCTGPLFEESVAEFGKKSTEFMQATFPIADGGVSAIVPERVYAAQRWIKLPSVPVLSQIGAGLAMKDLLGMVYQEEVQGSKADRFIGVVPRDYFDYRGLFGVTGMTTSTFSALRTRAAFVEERFWTTTAHEVAHTMGVGHVSQSSPVNGFWVALKQPVKNALNIMLKEGGVRKASLEEQWIDRDLYDRVFKEQLVDPKDPALLIVAGLIDRNGKVELKPLSYLPEGFESGSTPEDDSVVRLRDRMGAEIAAATFTTSFEILATSEGPIGSVPESDVAPFLVKLPYLSNASSVEIESKGKTLIAVYPNALLIRDTIQRISAASFKKTENLERKRLLKFSDQVDQFARYCHNFPKKRFLSERFEEEWQEQCSKIQLNLTFTLREQVVRSLTESTVRSAPLALIKSEALKNIDSAILRIISDQVSYGSRKEYDFKILPYRLGCRDEGLFRIVAVTQGISGSVRIERDGSVSYRPKSNVKEDQFTVTIKDSWGATVTKTMRIIPKRK